MSKFEPNLKFFCGLVQSFETLARHAAVAEESVRKSFKNLQPDFGNAGLNQPVAEDDSLVQAGVHVGHDEEGGWKSRQDFFRGE